MRAGFLVALAALFLFASSVTGWAEESYGPGPLLKEWRLGRVEKECGFRVVLVLESVDGSGLVEVALASGPERIGIEIVYDGRVNAYVVAGDQNAWHGLGRLELGKPVNITATYRVGGEARIRVSSGSMVYDRICNYSGGAPEELRLALSPVTGGGARIRIKELEVWRDWVKLALIPGVPGTSTSTESMASTTGASTVSRTTVSTSFTVGPVSSSSTSSSSRSSLTVESGLSLRGGRSGVTLVAAAVAALVIGVLAVLLHGSIRDRGP